MHSDVLVVGAGPAGLALTSALASRGLNVHNLSVDALRPWSNTYGAWEDEVTSLHVPTSHRWNHVRIHPRRPRDLERAYVLIDNTILHDRLTRTATDHDVTWTSGRAASVRHEERHSVVLDREGREHTARLVVDASGHAGFAGRATTGRAYQAAYGIVATFDRPPIHANSTVWMDYRASHLTEREFDDAPTFLYAMHLGEDRYFVEETSLAARPALPLTTLQDRLERRLARNGTPARHVERVERCVFPMNTPPPPHGRLVAFGGAAGLVHPASGFMVAHALRLVDPVAHAIAHHLANGRPPTDVARAAWQAVWPADARRAHRLYTFGLEALLHMRGAHLTEFFDAFFDLPAHHWHAFLSRTASSGRVARSMLQVFARAPSAVRFSLAVTAIEERRALLGAALDR